MIFQRVKEDDFGIDRNVLESRCHCDFFLKSVPLETAELVILASTHWGRSVGDTQPLVKNGCYFSRLHWANARLNRKPGCIAVLERPQSRQISKAKRSQGFVVKYISRIRLKRLIVAYSVNSSVYFKEMESKVMNRVFAKMPWKNPLLFCCIFLILIGSGTTSSAKGAWQDSGRTESEASTIGLEKGPMQKIAPSVKSILKIKFDVDNKSISVDQKSWGKEESLDDQKMAIRKQMLDRGLDKAMVDKMVDRMVQARTMSGPITKLFSSVSSSGGMRSTSASTSGNRRTMTCSGAELSCVIGLSPDQFELRIDEFTGPARALDIRSAAGTRMLLTGDDMLAMLNQTESGIMGVLIDGDEVASERATDYYALSKEHPDLHNKLAAIFRHAGVDLPLGINEPTVKTVAIRMMGSLYFGDRGALLKLIEKLNAGEFTVREEASEEIENSFPTFEGAISKELESDQLSIEARKRLEIIVKRQEQAKIGDRRAEDCVKANRLLDSTGYIISLFDIADEQGRRLITHHLAEITDQDFGMDVEKWKQWWQDNAK